MYVQYAPPPMGGVPPNGYYQGAGGMSPAYGASAMQGAVGSSGGYFQQVPQQSQYVSRSGGAYGQAPAMNVFQSPQTARALDQNFMPGLGNGYQPAMPAAQDGFSNGFYNGMSGQQQQPPQQAPPPQQPQQKPRNVQDTYGPPPPQAAPKNSAPQPWGSPASALPATSPPPAAGAPASAPMEDPDDDPARLPTFVKVRGVPQQFDPRIEKRPTNKKKRAPHVCCA